MSLLFLVPTYPPRLDNVVKERPPEKSEREENWFPGECIAD